MTLESKWTEKSAAQAIRSLGLTFGILRLGYRNAEYRVNLGRNAGGSEATAYYTNDLHDAVLTARAMRHGIEANDEIARFVTDPLQLIR